MDAGRARGVDGSGTRDSIPLSGSTIDEPLLCAIETQQFQTKQKYTYVPKLWEDFLVIKEETRVRESSEE